MLLMPLPIATLVILAQELNVLVPRLRTLSGMVMAPRKAQLWKAELPRLVTLFGIVIPFKKQASKADAPILRTLAGIVTLLRRRK
jgi:hypothetical protein